ncbi:diacylglycerol kinase family protein [bacterium]|nr:diacylglycerol kinase family protein [bacterium]
MTKFKSSCFKESLYHAFRGLRLAVSSQRNFLIEIFIGCFVTFIAILLEFSPSDFCILFIMILIVLVCELINSVIEFTLDAVYGNNYSKLVEMAKDMSAGMVLISAIASIVVGFVLFYPYVIKLFIE